MSDSAPPGPGDVDYRTVPTAYAGLRPVERRVAWAVVRAIATAAWWAAGVLAVAWLALCVHDHALLPLPGLCALGLLVAAAALEVQVAALRGHDDDS